MPCEIEMPTVTSRRYVGGINQLRYLKGYVNGG